MQHRPSPTIAGLLALLTPGLGHVYSGRVWRGILLAVCLQSIGVLAVVLILNLPWRPWNVVVPLLLIPIAVVAVIVDAVVLAHRTQSREPAWYNRWYVYGAIILIAAFVVQPVEKRALRSRIRTFTLTSGSMAPTLLPGDYVAITMGQPDELDRGDIVLFHWPGDRTIEFVKRVVGLPGDTLEMRERQLLVNGSPLDEPYLQVLGEPDGSYESMDWQSSYLLPGRTPEPYAPTRDTWGPILIPEDRYFVLGDNRDESLDSRYLGLVPLTSIMGRPRRLYFSRDEETGTIRWERIGLPTFRD